MHRELARFAEEIQVLYGDLRREATLQPIEPHLTLSFAGDGKGHIEVVGTAQNHFASGTELSFSLEADQTYLPGIAKAPRAAESPEWLWPSRHADVCYETKVLGSLQVPPAQDLIRNPREKF
jgi:hypothetical protein